MVMPDCPVEMGGSSGERPGTACLPGILNVLRSERRHDVDFHPELTRDFHRELTHLEVMLRGSLLGQGMRDLLLFSGFGGRGACLEAEAVVAGFQDVATMREAVE